MYCSFEFANGSGLQKKDFPLGVKFVNPALVTKTGKRIFSFFDQARSGVCTVDA